VAVTRSWEHKVTVTVQQMDAAARRQVRRPSGWLAIASLMVACGLAFVYFAKTQDFAEQQRRLNSGELLNLNAVSSSPQLLPYLDAWRDPAQRELVAGRIAAFLEKSKPLANVGALARLRLTRADIDADSRWSGYRAQLGTHGAVRLIPLAKLKPSFVVRTPRDFLRAYVIWMAVYLAAFWLVHFAWKLRAFRGDPTVLPALQLLSGMGLILAVSLRDPLRDTMEFSKFAWGVAAGCMMLLLPLLRPFNYRNFARFIYTPLLLALALFIALLRFGSGPTGSDAKVNLGPFQPVELIKILLVFFLAGYFARRWEWLRELREKTFVPRWLRWLQLPGFAHALPVMCGVAVALFLFFVLKDLGPALVTGFLFLLMFAVARGRSGLALTGLALLVGGVTLGYRMGAPHTVVERISMWQSPWDNNIRGGDQLAHSLWAFATGGPFGSGPGWGDPGMIPAGHTDLVLSAIGEEWGFAGVLTVALMFAFLLHRAFRAALRASDEYAFFLAMGMGALIALEMLLISGGALGAIPLSGVVSPFLSSGNTAMIANFLIFAIILAVANRGQGEDEGVELVIAEPFRKPLRALGIVLAGAAACLVAKAASVQVLQDNDLMARDANVIQEDGAKRPQHNPRLNSLAHELARGTIYDRNGLPLATSSWDELIGHRADYQKLGIDVQSACSRMDGRYYPLGSAAAHLLGDVRTADNFHASNASLIEHDANTTLQGFGNYRELAAFVRYRHQPGSAAMQQLRARDRTVHTTIDARLQVRAADTLAKHLAEAGKERGALVIMNPQSGDVLALVSLPAPAANSAATPDQLLDRARYGFYPPGSTFKLVTAMAALRLDPNNEKRSFHCARLPDGRAGTMVRGWNRPIRDDIGDHPHGTLTMARAIQVSCNAYFAQLGTYVVGAEALHKTADLLDIPAGDIKDLKKMMPFAAYGQGPVLISPFKMARVAATVADNGDMPQGRWIVGQGNARSAAGRSIVTPADANFIGSAMRMVVTGGTGRRAMAGLDVQVAGKTGTAQMDEGLPHSWFAGFAPFDAPPDQRIAFAVMVEHGGYGGQLAAPIARDLVQAARDLGIITASPSNGGKQ